MQTYDARLRRSILWLVFALWLVLIFNLPARTDGADKTGSQCGRSLAEIPKPSSTFPKSRDSWSWPFSHCSIWNMPIGSNAQYSSAHLQNAGRLAADREYFYKLKDGDPMRQVLSPGNFGLGRCTGTQSMQLSLPIPDNLIVLDATSQPYSTPNNAAAFLMPDGKTIEQLEPLARCTAGGNIHGWRNPSSGVDIKSDGIKGTHFGSGLSALGASIRRGELTNDAPIRHAIKILLWGKKYLHFSESVPGYRWPTDRADRYAAREYAGKNPKLVQGSLLAIPPNVKSRSLGLKTTPGKKLFMVLQNYGGYVVDDAFWDAYYIVVEQEVPEEFKQHYGYDFEEKNGAFQEDVMKLFQALHIIDNNFSDSIGGGGKLRAPLAPYFGA